MSPTTTKELFYVGKISVLTIEKSKIEVIELSGGNENERERVALYLMAEGFVGKKTKIHY